MSIACANEDGQAEPQGPTTEAPAPAPASNAATANLPHSGAPAVDNPLPEPAVSGDPCQTLTPEQVKAALGDNASDGERRDLDELGPGCRWSNTGTHASFAVSFQTETGEGLSAAYANAKPKMTVFNEVDPIEDYPAVQYKKGEDDPMCSTVVGVANEYAIGVTGTIGTDAEAEGKDPCEPGKQVASWIVANVKTQS